VQATEVTTMPTTIAVTATRGRKFGWTPPDQSIIDRARLDFGLDYSMESKNLPGSVDLRPDFPPVYNQGDYQSCTVNAIVAIIQYLRRAANLSNVMPSRMFVYWFSRLANGTVEMDAGSTVQAAVQSAIDHGCCNELIWPYSREDLYSSPSAAAVADAAHHVVSGKESVAGLDGIRTLLSRRQPVATGLLLFDSFFDADKNGGTVSMPDTTKPSAGHAGVFVGYVDQTKQLVFRSSWGELTPDGTPCGDRGHYYLPYAYVTEGLATDFWALSGVSDA
jgi:hypothetical protein